MLDLNAKGNLTEIVFDEKNKSPVELVNTRGERLKMEQVFATEYEGQLYCILAPINRVEGLENGTGLVFSLEDNRLTLEQSSEICKAIFDLYYSAVGGNS